MIDMDKRLIWIDLEMTGLDPSSDLIIEIATVITDWQLDVVAEGPVLAIHQSDEILDAMDEWNTRQHAESGLTQRVKDSRLEVQEAEAHTLTFLMRHVSRGRSPMCGNSICQDRRFMARLMPDLAAYFHYRNLDVTTLKILANMWHPEVAARSQKSSAHLALEDIYDSIHELKVYREHLLRTSGDAPTGSGSR